MRSIGIDVPKKLEELLMAMSCFVLSEDLASGYVERGEESRSTMTNVIMANAFEISQSHGKHWLCSFKGLNLAFFIYAKHHGFVRWIEVKARYIAHFFNKERVSGEFEVFLPMGLQAEGMPNALHS